MTTAKQTTAPNKPTAKQPKGFSDLGLTAKQTTAAKAVQSALIGALNAESIFGQRDKTLTKAVKTLFCRKPTAKIGKACLYLDSQAKAELKRLDLTTASQAYNSFIKGIRAHAARHGLKYLAKTGEFKPLPPKSDDDDDEQGDAPASKPKKADKGDNGEETKTFASYQELLTHNVSKALALSARFWEEAHKDATSTDMQKAEIAVLEALLKAAKQAAK